MAASLLILCGGHVVVDLNNDGEYEQALLVNINDNVRIFSAKKKW